MVWLPIVLWFSLAAGGPDPLQLTIRPAVSFAPATIHILIRIEPHEDNAWVRVTADGDLYYRSTDIYLPGRQAPRYHDVWWKDMPTGEYILWAYLGSRHGKLRAQRHREFTILGRGGP